MAARRIAKSAIDWAAFAERVPPNQREAFRAFKARSDFFIARVHRFPEKLPEIDFAYYKGRLSSPAVVDEYEKAYKALAVAYPKDKGNVKAQIDEQEKQAQEVTKQQIADARKSIDEAKALLGKIDSVPSPDVMTQEMYADYFPEQALNPWERPTFWPHTKSYQPENDPHTIK